MELKFGRQSRGRCDGERIELPENSKRDRCFHEVLDTSAKKVRRSILCRRLRWSTEAARCTLAHCQDFTDSEIA